MTGKVVVVVVDGGFVDGGFVDGGRVVGGWLVVVGTE